MNLNEILKQPFPHQDIAPILDSKSNINKILLRNLSKNLSLNVDSTDDIIKTYIKKKLLNYIFYGLMLKYQNRLYTFDNFDYNQPSIDFFSSDEIDIIFNNFKKTYLLKPVNPKKQSDETKLLLDKIIEKNVSTFNKTHKNEQYINFNRYNEIFSSKQYLNALEKLQNKINNYIPPQSHNQDFDHSILNGNVFYDGINFDNIIDLAFYCLLHYDFRENKQYILNNKNKAFYEKSIQNYFLSVFRATIFDAVMEDYLYNKFSTDPNTKKNPFYDFLYDNSKTIELSNNELPNDYLVELTNSLRNFIVTPSFREMDMYFCFGIFFQNLVSITFDDINFLLNLCKIYPKIKKNFELPIPELFKEKINILIKYKGGASDDVYKQLWILRNNILYYSYLENIQNMTDKKSIKEDLDSIIHFRLKNMHLSDKKKMISETVNNIYESISKKYDRDINQNDHLFCYNLLSINKIINPNQVSEEGLLNEETSILRSRCILYL